MEIVTIATMVLVISFFPIKTGWVAKDLGRNYWVWLFLGLFLPFISMVILLCLPIKKKQMEQKSLPQSDHSGHAQNIYKRVKCWPASESKKAS